MRFVISKINRVSVASYFVAVSVALCLLATGTPFFDIIFGVNWVNALCLTGMVTLAVGALTLVILKFETFTGFQQALQSLAWHHRDTSEPTEAVLFVAWGPALDKNHKSMFLSGEKFAGQEAAGYAD